MPVYVQKMIETLDVWYYVLVYAVGVIAMIFSVIAVQFKKKNNHYPLQFFRAGVLGALFRFIRRYAKCSCLRVERNYACRLCAKRQMEMVDKPCYRRAVHCYNSRFFGNRLSIVERRISYSSWCVCGNSKQ